MSPSLSFSFPLLFSPPCSFLSPFFSFPLYSLCALPRVPTLPFAFPLLSCISFSYLKKQNCFPFVLQFSSPCVGLCSAYVPSLLTPLPYPFSAHYSCPWASLPPTSAHFHMGFQLQYFQVMLLFPPSPMFLMLLCLPALSDELAPGCDLNVSRIFFFLLLLKKCHKMEFEHQNMHFSWKRFNPRYPIDTKSLCGLLPFLAALALLLESILINSCMV